MGKASLPAPSANADTVIRYFRIQRCRPPVYLHTGIFSRKNAPDYGLLQIKHFSVKPAHQTSLTGLHQPVISHQQYLCRHGAAPELGKSGTRLLEIVQHKFSCDVKMFLINAFLRMENILRK